MKLCYISFGLVAILERGAKSQKVVKFIIVESICGVLCASCFHPIEDVQIDDKAKKDPAKGPLEVFGQLYQGIGSALAKSVLQAALL